MTRVELYQHPFRADPPQVFEVDNLALWILERYERTGGVNFQVFAGDPSGKTDITQDEGAILRGDAERYVVLESPGAPLIPGLIMMAISMAVQAIMSKPVPVSNRSQDSPNNQLSNRQNQVRTLQRVEDIFGTVKSIPSLLMPTYKKYIQNQESEYGYYCVGRGYYDVSSIQDGDTLLSEINGASAAVYAPFTSPNGGTPQLQIGDPIIDGLLTVRPSTSVGGIALKAANQLQLKTPSAYIFAGPGSGSGIVPGSVLDTIAQQTSDRKPNVAAVAQQSQVLTISMSNTTQIRTVTGSVGVNSGTKTYTVTMPGFFRGVVVGSTVTVGGTGWANPGQNTGAKTVTAVTDTTLTVSDTGLVTESGVGSANFTLTINYSGTRTIAAVSSGYVTLTGTPIYAQGLFESFSASITVANSLVDWTDWFTLPATDRTEVWTNTLAQAGMYKDDGAKQDATVEYEVQIEQLDLLLNPTGNVETVTGSITGATTSMRADTLERVTGWIGPARVRARRTTPYDYDFSGFVQDDIAWQDLYSVSPVNKSDFGNKTTIHTVTLATSSSTAQSTRELNCIASRKIPTYDGFQFSGTLDSTGRLASGTISASSRLVDIICAVTVDPKIGNRPVTDLDLPQLWGVQSKLDNWNHACGQFNYTFDSDQVSFEDTLSTIANAAFCAAYRQNGKIRLSADLPQSNSIALFTHRNKKPTSETITRRFAADSDYDGVELAYQDPDTLSSETIRLPLDGSYTKLKQVEIPGIRNYTQAWFRANREYNRIRSQRLNIQTDATTDARAILPNSRIDIVDNTRFKSFDGEVVAQNGLTLTLSRDVEFIADTPHSIILMQREGGLQSIACTQGASANQVVLSALPSEAIVTTQTPDGGIRTIFSFAADSARGSQAWLVQSIGISDGQYMTIQAINYSDDYYAADTQPVPNVNGVIYN